ncbi:MAG: DUF1906 domain-containing protein, partial [Anaerolineales bacterium]|nr:DUF1906 domain-containing protein [Anaerolineales bacterium]
MALSQQRALKTALISLALGGLFLLGLPNLAGNPALASRVGQPGRTGPSGVGAGVQISTPEVLITSTTYLPILHVFTVELNGFWVEDQASVRRNGFEPGEGMVFVTDGWVNRPDSVTTTLKLTDTGPCESGVVFSQTVALPPNGWVYLVPETAQNCTGIFTTTTSLTFGEVVLSKSAEHVVNPPSQVAVSGHPGFDKCAVTSVENMQTWWDESPYAVTNLYIGGAAFACPNQALDAVWIHKVAKQGWTFIPTWVGPQAPCTGFNHRMSWNASTAYQEGKDEAAAAAAAARNYGFFGGNVIYYDLEAFPNASTACRAATDAFMTGWTEQLHDLGFKAGGYGQECSSYMTDWVDNSPSPDDIWWARWPFPPWSYDPTASVFGSSCIPDNYWDDHQRIRQYTGGHQETWGPTTLTIDSNILDGEVNLLPVGAPRVEGELQQATVIYEGPAIRGHGLTGPGEGWVWVDERILKSENGGIGWQEITPDRLVPIGVSFRDKWN